MQDNKQSVEQLEKFKELIHNYFDGNYEDERIIKSEINRIIPMVKELVSKANCLNIMSMAPPQAIGGRAIENFNPFDMIFHNFWGISIIPNIVDMVEQSIGMYENNLINTEENKKTIIQGNIRYPEKITFKWLFENVPMKLWSYFFVILIASFGLGFELSEILHKTTTVLEKK